MNYSDLDGMLFYFINGTRCITSEAKLIRDVATLLAFCIVKVYCFVKVHIIELSLMLCVTIMIYYWKSVHRKTEQARKNPPPRALYEIALDSHDKVCADLCVENIDKYNYDVNCLHPDTGLSVFHYACLSGNTMLIKFMLEKGGDVNSFTEFGDSPFYFATYGYLQSSKSDFYGLTMLMTYGSDVNHGNHIGFTSLHQAAGYGDLTLTKYLILKGADPNKPNFFGVLPHDTACLGGHQDVAEFLEGKMKKFSKRRTV